MDDKDSLIIKLKDEIATLKDKINIMQGQLEKYTNNDRHKRYYEKNKEKVKQNAKQYLDNLKVQNPEKLKEYRHRAYIRRKERNQMDFLVGLS